jgi:hypothetical protein
MRIISVIMFLVLCSFASGSPLLDNFDPTWSERWWTFCDGGYSLGAGAIKDHLQITGKGPGYGILQSKTALIDRIRSLTGTTPSGLYLKVRGKKGTAFTLEIEGNKKVPITLGDASGWTMVKIPFTQFSPPISFHDFKTAGFIQFNFGGRVDLELAAIGWLYPKKYDTAKLVDLEISNFRTKPNREYNPFLHVGGTGKGLRLIEVGDEGWIETFSNNSAPRQSVGFEADGRFDEGGCPDWTQIETVTFEIKATKKETLTAEFYRPGETKPVTSAVFQVEPEFRTIHVPVAGLISGIGGCAITMPAGVDIQLKRAGVLAPEGMYQEEMERRGQKNIRYYRWRNSVFQTRGLDFYSLREAVKAFEKSVHGKDFSKYYEQKNNVDRFYWYGIELLALRAMNLANLDRAEATKDQSLIDQARKNREKISVIVSSLKNKIELPSLKALYDDENKLCEKTIALVKQKDLRPYVKGRQFYSPSGKPINYYGPHSFIASRKGMLFRQEGGFDQMYKRLSALGFNGIRFEAMEYIFMPTEAGVDPNTFRDYNEGIQTAWKYGLWVQYDNHFYFPGWVCAGSKEFPNPSPAGQSNSYQNLPATVKVWDQTAKNLKDCKNIFVFETPSNEPFFFDNTGKSILNLPAMMHEWNQFLKRKYQTRDALVRAWTENVESPGLNPLLPEEDWDKNSILPPGFIPKDLAAKSADLKNQNTRVWDWLMFAAYLQEKTTGAIAEAVKKHIPSATFMLQFIIGDEWDQNPIRFSYQSILQARGKPDENIFIGSHYGVAGKQVLKAIALGTPSTDSENPGEGNYASYLTQKLYNSGASVFADYARWGGGMLWENDDCDFKESTAYIPLIADFFTTAEPLYQKPIPKVMIVEPTRLAGTRQNDFVNVAMEILGKAGVDYHLLEEHYIISHPDVLKKYECAIVNVTQINPALLDALKESNVKVFLFGSPFKDAFCRVYPAGILGWFTQNNILIRSYSPQAAQTETAVNRIGLEGDVKFKYDEKKTADAEKWAAPGYDDATWTTKPIPGYWGELIILGSRKYFLGDGWYRFHVDIPAEWKNKEITLRVGAIDDTDEAFINGKLFGKTTIATSNWWQAPRNYVLPNAQIKFGRKNVIAIKVTNTLDDAGIYLAPVVLATRDAAVCKMKTDFGFLAKNEELNIVLSREHFYPAESNLTPSAQVLAGFGKKAALIRDNNFTFVAPGLQEKILLSFLKHAGLTVKYPAKPEPRIYPFTNHYYIVQGFSDADTTIKIKGTHYQPIGMEVLANPKNNGEYIEVTVPKSALCLIRVW